MPPKRQHVFVRPWRESLALKRVLNRPQFLSLPRHKPIPEYPCRTPANRSGSSAEFKLSQSDVLKNRIPCSCERYANLKNSNTSWWARQVLNLGPTDY
jgi:hypothetical protein